MATLDLKRSYGTVTGFHAASFEQDGKLFDANHDEIVETVEKTEAPAEKKTAKEAKADAKADALADQIAKQAS